MKQRLVSGLVFIALFAGCANAATLDLSPFGSGLEASPIILPEATLISSTGVFEVLDVATDRFCAVGDASCAHDFTVEFTTPVSNLSFEVFAAMSGDVATVTAFDTGGNDIGVINLGEGSSGINGFGALGGIARLVFDDETVGSNRGFSFGNFAFDQGVGEVPLPAAALLMPLGAFLLRRRR